MIKQTMRALYQTRTECHEKVFELATKNVSKVEILRYPNTIEQKLATSKLIVVVNTVEQAEEIKKSCIEVIEKANETINILCGRMLPRYTIRYGINIISSHGDISLTVSDAQKRQTVSGEWLLDLLGTVRVDENGEELREFTEEILDDFLLHGDDYIPVESAPRRVSMSVSECRQLIDPKGKYIVAKSTGRSYRCTYYDVEVNHRKQVSVGDILLVVGNGKVVTSAMRKERADRKEPLFRIDGLTIYNG